MENSKTVKLDFLNRLFFGKGSLSVWTDGICLDADFHEFPSPLQQAELKQGVLIDRIAWGTECFRLIRNEKLRQAFASIESDRVSYWLPRYLEHFNQLVEVSMKFENYISTFNRYIRESHKTDFLKRLESSSRQLTMMAEYSALGFDTSNISETFISFVSNPSEFVAERNNKFLVKELTSIQYLFEDLESHPLTERQREACVYDEDNVLVIAGAGTGKTSTMRAKAAYLVHQGFVRPEEILMLAYGNKAREELEERVYELDYLKGVKIRTFHSLGKEIIGQYEGRATNVSVLASDSAQYSKFIDNQLNKMISESVLYSALTSFFSEYQYPQSNDLEFKTHGEYLAYLKNNEIRDLSGNSVKSFEELRISNYLFRNGISFEYEREYPFPVSDPGRNVYKPDYYLPDLDVFIEHFGINETGETRPGIDKAKYNKDREWKINVHKKCDTKLIQTFSYQSKTGLESALEAELKKHCELNSIDFESILAPVTSESLLNQLKELGTFKNFSKLLANFLTLFKNSSYSIDGIPYSGKNLYDKTRQKVFHVIFKWVYERYCSVLGANKSIDFADMIREAEKMVCSDDFHDVTESQYRFRYIMVDEFQDISPVRADLIKALRAVGSNCSLFCVGDDWQAIYRFTGSDVSLTTEFSKHFGKTHQVILDKTFRFNNRIECVASRFVQENDHQLKKELMTHEISNKTEVRVIRGYKEEVLRNLLGQLVVESKPGTSVLVLSRFKESLKSVSPVEKEFPGLRIRSMSAHSAKGKQADYVIILNVIDGKYGFPSKVTTDPLLETLLPSLESFVYAEERRLFYVALTRARQTVFIHTLLGKESDFLTEMKVKGFDIQFDKDELSRYVIETAHCPECRTGSLIPRQSQFGLFYVCGLGKDYCDTIVEACPGCKQAPLLRNNRILFCADPNCDFKAELCPVCMVGRLVERENSRTGNKFMGCSMFKRSERGSCTYTAILKKSKKSKAQI